MNEKNNNVIEVVRSSRYKKILGDFGERILMYWLSKRNFEPVLVDFTGIDIIAYNKEKKKRIGISVKSRIRLEGDAEERMNVKSKQVQSMKQACEYFDCDPYFGCVVDAEENKAINIYLVPYEDLLRINEYDANKNYLYIKFTSKYIKLYEELKNSYIIKLNYNEKKTL